MKNEVTSIAIGGFDGMHLAHQELFSKLDEKSAIVVIETGYANLTPNRHREEHTKFPISYYPLENIKHLDGKSFVKLLLEEFPSLQKIVVGFDFCFGANRKHCIDDLKELFHGEVVVVDEIKCDDIGVHSRIIRKYIADGEMDIANRFLNTDYSILGTVIKGQGLGKKEFVPTINLHVDDFLLPNEGVYVTNTFIGDTKYKSVSFLGHRVSTDGSFAIETHILNDDIGYVDSKYIKISFIKKLRDNKSFESFTLLRQQIDTDITQAKEYFKMPTQVHKCTTASVSN